LSAVSYATEVENRLSLFEPPEKKEATSRAKFNPEVWAKDDAEDKDCVGGVKEALLAGRIKWSAWFIIIIVHRNTFAKKKEGVYSESNLEIIDKKNPLPPCLGLFCAK
jgi:hypothetical protein